MNHRSAVAAALLFAFTALAQGADKPNSAEGWRELTLRDLADMRRKWLDHTPIPFDKENPGYLKWLEDGYRLAVDRAETVKTEGGWYYTLAFYQNGFGDPHVSLSPIGVLPPASWPGFIATARGDDAMVVFRDESDAEAPSVGSRILQCDGKSIGALLGERVHPFVTNAKLSGDRRRAVTRLFYDRQNPFAPPLERCTTESAGMTKEISLTWRDLPADADDWNRRYQDAGLGPRTSFGITEPAPGVAWIGVPTFSSGESAAPELEKLIDAVKSKAQVMREGRAIVIDVRGNGGGNSAWADKLAEAIFGADVLRRHAPPQPGYAVDWRASTGNATHWRDWETRMRKEFGFFSQQRFSAERTASQLEAHVERGTPLYRQGAEGQLPSGGMTGSRPRGEGPFKARVFLLSNGTCGSSCLNFADTVLFVPGVKLIGAATSGDGMLMETRTETLASGLARVTLPQKVARGRARGHLEVYEPDVAHIGAWDEASVREWVLKTVLAP